MADNPPQDKPLDPLTSIFNRGTPPAPPGGPPRGAGDGDDELGARMTFLEHLDELRRRIIRCMIAVAVTFGVAWIFHERIYQFLAVPIAKAVGGAQKLVFIKPTEPFTIYLKVSFVVGIFLAIPVILLQLWFFISPALYRREKTYAIPFLVSSTLLFLLGGVFAYYVILPAALDFLINQFGKNFTPMVSAIEYFDFEMVIILGMGAIFEMPVIVAFLSIFGLITPRFLWVNFRYAFLLIIIVAAVASPTGDALNLFLWSGPMILLYVLSIGVSWIFKRRREKKFARSTE